MKTAIKAYPKHKQSAKNYLFAFTKNWKTRYFNELKKDLERFNTGITDEQVLSFIEKVKEKTMFQN
jgi:hypothetical protein